MMGSEKHARRTSQDSGGFETERILLNMWLLAVTATITGGIIIGGLHSISSPYDLSDEYNVLIIYLVVVTTVVLGGSILALKLWRRYIGERGESDAE